MATRLYQVLTFNAIPAGGQATLGHSINVDGVAKIPDFLYPDAGGFTLVAADASTITVQNDNVGAASLNLALYFIYSSERLFGQVLSHLTPDPFFVSGGGAAGTGSTLQLTNDEVGVVPAGTPIYVDAPNGFKRSQADAQATARTIGLLTANVAPGVQGAVQLSGPITLTTAQWDAICGTIGGLAFDVPYYLDAASPGALTATPPSATGAVVQQVIIGVSPTTAVIQIGIPEVLGSGSTIIQLRNDNAGAIPICSPVYSDAADGMDLGIANGTGKSRIIGLVVDVSVPSGAQGDVAVSGIFVATTGQWDAVAGTVGGLLFNTPYYLDPTTPGKLTSVAPSTPGQEVAQVIVALSTTEARIAIQPPIPL